MPTPQQAMNSVIVCQMLSNLYQPINLFRFDNITKQIYILAGQEDTLEIIINPQGKWKFTDDET